MVLAISVTFELKLATVDDCHFIIAPTAPDSCSELEFVPEHTVAGPDIVPATDGALPIIITPFEYEGTEGELVTFAR